MGRSKGKEIYVKVGGYVLKNKKIIILITSVVL